MFQFRLLLLFVGVCGVILETNSYSYPTAYPQPEASYGYMSYAPPVYPSYSPPSYGSYGKGYGSSYSANCGYMKVIEVLDQIFCQHAEKKRYSSTIYPTIDVIIDQLDWTSYHIYVPYIYSYVVAAIHELKTLQDAVYGNYGDSSLLQPYYEGYEEYYYEGYDEDNQSQTAGTTAGGTRTGSTTRVNMGNRVTGAKTKLDGFVAQSTTFKNSQGINLQQGSKQSQTQSKGLNADKEKTTRIEVDITEDKVSQRAGLVKLTVGETQETKTKDANNEPLIDAQLLSVSKAKRSPKQSLLSRIQANSSAYSRSRKTRGAEYTDYTCSYLSPIYCSEDKYDELLYNILVRIFTAYELVGEALGYLWEFLEDLDCSENQEAYRDAAIVYGELLVSYYTLYEVLEDVERMYEIMELDYGDDSGSYYRAGGSSSNTPVYSTPPQPSSYPVKPMPIPSYVSKVSTMPSYPYSGYIAQPASSVSYSVPQQQYRLQRAAVSPAIPQVFLIG